MSEDKKGRNFLVGGVVVLMLQNFMVLIGSLFKYSEGEYVADQLEAVYDKDFQWFIDIAGFALLAVAFYFFALANDNEETARKMKMAAASFAGWVILRILWQYIFMPDLETQLFYDFQSDDPSDPTFDGSVSLFLIASIVLLLAGIFLYQLEPRNLVFLTYTGINLFSSIFIFLSFHTKTEDIWRKLNEGDSEMMDTLTYRLKFILIPLLSLIALYKMADRELKEVFKEFQEKNATNATIQK